MKRLPLLPLLFLALGLQAQTQTKLIFVAHWDNGTAVQGTVTLAQSVLGQPDTWIASRTLSTSGRASFSFALAPNSFYDVSLTLPDGSNISATPFTFSTVGLDLVHLTLLQDTVVFRLADNSLAKQTVTVAMVYP